MLFNNIRTNLLHFTFKQIINAYYWKAGEWISNCTSKVWCIGLDGKRFKSEKVSNCSLLFEFKLCPEEYVFSKVDTHLRLCLNCSCKIGIINWPKCNSQCLVEEACRRNWLCISVQEWHHSQTNWQYIDF